MSAKRRAEVQRELRRFLTRFKLDKQKIEERPAKTPPYLELEAVVSAQKLIPKKSKRSGLHKDIELVVRNQLASSRDVVSRGLTMRFFSREVEAAGRVLLKAFKTYPRFRRWIVQDPSDGRYECAVVSLLPRTKWPDEADIVMAREKRQ